MASDEDEPPPPPFPSSMRTPPPEDFDADSGDSSHMHELDVQDRSTAADRTFGFQPDSEIRTPHRPLAFSEPSHIRFAYLVASLGRVYRHQTVEQATFLLRSMLKGYAVAKVCPENPKPVTTLQAAMNRLGIDPDEHITVYSACPTCWKLYSPQELGALPGPECTATGCSDLIYT
ncbi:hypothetical protein EXIGLDRAFT_771822 [Exidia glandulosa HHB12029]|uniref:Uncharacterized protein n=1 Tax=Exidia glandulosa HHB12029 TaxID=1314781 RepID=A0A165FQS8_EXIGL|nr:hypothetical protein EXIGLDRAFT_771822 [Exidia glandulosa HHB12029]